MNMLMVHEAFARSRGDVVAAADRLARDRERIDGIVSGFLGAGWTGVAADAFSTAWADWLVGATDVKEGLDAMAALLDAVQRDFVQQDDASQRALDAVSAKIVDRLG